MMLAIGVSDMPRAKAFYADKLSQDTTMSLWETRWPDILRGCTRMVGNAAFSDSFLGSSWFRQRRGH